MNTRHLIAATLLATALSGVALAEEQNIDREEYLDRKGDRIEERLDNKGDRIDERLAVLGVQLKVDAVHVSEAFEEDGFPLHHRF